MLIQFKFKNFKSFKDEQLLSMVATSTDKSLPDNLTTLENFGKERLLNSGVIYGANASGKTNVLDALKFVKHMVVDSYKGIGDGIPVQPFLLEDATSKTVSEFEISFIHHKIRYQYAFSLDKKQIHTEYLIAYPNGKPQIWFERNPDLKDGWRTVRNEVNNSLKALQKYTRPEVLFLSLAASLNNEKLNKVYEWFDSWLSFGDPNENHDHYETVTMLRMVENPDLQPKFKTLIQQADLGIADFKVENKVVTSDTLPEGMPEVLRSFILANGETRSIEPIINHRTAEPNVTVPFNWGMESAGTRRFFGIGGLLLEALEQGRVLVVDELDTALHPLLVRALVALFSDPQVNTKHAQLIFNTHDVTLLDLTFLRRDQFWFTQKDKGGASQLYALLEFKPRDNEAIQNRYLHGSYDGIPFRSESLLAVS